MKPMAVLSCILLGVMCLAQPLQARAQSDDPTPPTETVKMIFIHHSTGENWLTDGYGDLGRTLGENNYFVSDTNYGWGPDGIGDRTDIPNWPEWFRSERTPVYMEALFNENEQHANYTRTLADPGGENEIVMFKSCFPNSALAGSPNDPPTPGYDLSVGNAKYVYNEILQYFATRPDKLFVVITAPPLSDPEYATNARAFNLWLMQDWLAENDYPYNNVAVFDFYNILTAPDAHHRFAGGRVEHTLGNRNTLYYPSGDDHPSEAGSQKATEEFVPLLNVFYHRWKTGQEAAPTPTQAPEATETPPPVEAAAPIETPQAAAQNEELIDNFDAGAPSGTDGWSANWDASTPTTLTCAPENGTLRAALNIAADSWGTCTLFYGAPQNWQAAGGLAFALRVNQPGLTFDVNVYGGSLENAETYAFTLEAPPEAAAGWAEIFVPWGELRRVEWEENPGTPLDPGNVVGLGFGFGAPAEAAMQGEIWVEDLRLTNAPAVESGETAPTEATAPAPTDEPAPTQAAPNQPAQLQPTPEKTSRPGLCPGSAALIVVALGAVAWRQRAARPRRL